MTRPLRGDGGGGKGRAIKERELFFEDNKNYPMVIKLMTRPKVEDFFCSFHKHNWILLNFSVMSPES